MSTRVVTSAERTGAVRRANLGDALRRQAARQPSRIAVVDYDAEHHRREISYGALDRQANRLANTLLGLGLEKGDVVAAVANNRLEYVIAYYATLKAGGCFTGVNPQLTPRELTQQLAHAEPRFVVALDSDIVRLGAVSPNRHSISFSGWGAPAFEASEGVSDDDPGVPVLEHDVALIVYTSGTESEPKGVVLPHRNFLLATTPSWVVDRYIEADDVFLLLAPLYTMAGVGTLTNLMSIGATAVLMERARGATALQVIAAERVTNMSQTPTFYSQLAATPEFGTTDLGSVRQCHTYGGPIPAGVVRRFRERAPHILWATYWGQSELSQLGIVGFYRDLDDVPGRDLRWIGRPMAAVEVRVVDEDGLPAEVGELECRSPAIMYGYHKDESATRQVIVDGWLRTGDIVRRDADANLFFFDRRKDIIKTGGMNVSSLEVENVLLSHPAITEAAVVGLPDPYWSEAVTAFVVVADGVDFDESSILETCRAELAAFKVPKRFVVVEALPRDRQGKVLKRELRDRNDKRETP